MLHLDNPLLPIIMTDVKVGLFSGLNLAVMSMNGAKEQQENPEHISTQYTPHRHFTRDKDRDRALKLCIFKILVPGHIVHCGIVRLPGTGSPPRPSLSHKLFSRVAPIRFW